MACSRGDVQPKPGATVWAGVGWVNGRRRRSGPAVRMTRDRGWAHGQRDGAEGRREFEGQVTTTLDPGEPSKACNRTWTLPYTPSGAKPIRFTTTLR
jgi:hypothetical protein